MDAAATLALAGVTLAAAGVQAATGFGFAILAAPVFLAALGSTAAIPILVALHVVQSALVVPKVWRRVPPSLFLSLGAGALIGMPLGLAVFQTIGLRELNLGAGL
ncbi:MAG: hypothetical protein AB7O57_10375, partial [Hyphomicrobiaceae bacterium]